MVRTRARVFARVRKSVLECMRRVPKLEPNQLSAPLTAMSASRYPARKNRVPQAERRVDALEA
eukprot:3950661-Pleurochrysis_carterae.AAC.1